MNKNFPRSLFIIASIVFLLMMVALGVFFYNIEYARIEQEKAADLRTLTDIKSIQISRWYLDEMNDAELIANSTSLWISTTDLSRLPKAEGMNRLVQYFVALKAEHDYKTILVTDKQGNILLSSDEKLLPLQVATLNALKTLAQGQSGTSDLYHHDSGSVYIDFIAPFRYNGFDSAEVYLVMQMNPGQYLNSIIENLQVSGSSIETVWLRKDGDSVLVLNNLRFVEHSALHFKLPLTKAQMVTVKAGSGFKGTIAGKDYCGEDVLAYMSPIKNTSWFILTKIDVHDFTKEFRQQMLLLLSILVLIGLMIGGAFFFLYSRRRSNYFRSLWKEQAKFKTTFYSIGDAVIITDNEGKVKNLNRVAELITGWEESEVLNRPIEEVFNIVHEGDQTHIESPVIKVLRDGVIVGLANHTSLITKSGDEIPIADSGAPIIDENGEIIGVVLVFRDQSLERQKQQQLQESEESYRWMFQHNPQPMMIYDPESYSICEVNDAAVNRYGYSHDEFLLLKVTDITPKEDQEIMRSAIQSLKGASYYPTRVWRHINKNGDIMEVEITSHLITYNNRPARHVLLNDITERLKAEELLQKSEHKFRVLFENHSAVKLILDPVTGQIEDANDSAAVFYGWPREQLRQMNIADINTLSWEQMKLIIPGIISRKEGRLEFKHRKSDGSVWDVEVFSSIIQLDGKDYLHSIVQDITTKRKAEARVRLLIRSIEQSPVGILISNSKAKTEYVNPRFSEMSGFTKEEMIGKVPRILSKDGEDHSLQEDIWAALNAGLEWRGEYQDQKFNGELYWKNVAISPVLDSGGEIKNYVVIQEDNTEQINLRNELISARQQAEESDRLKSAFLANMSHEIRTPMNGILGFMDLLQDPGLTGDERDEYIGIVRSSGDRLLSTINDIIDISKIESGQSVLNLSQFNMSDLLNRLVSFFKLQAVEKGLTLKLETQEQMCPSDIISDIAKIESIYTNLIRNAIKFTSHGSIRFGCKVKGNQVEGFVEDTGVGIPVERQERIFERFVQGETSYSREYEGSGLGLAITSAYVEMLGGTIQLKSKIGEGSRFDFSFKVEPVLKSTATETVSATKKSGNRAETIVLVAEDDEISFIFLSKLLAGHKISLLHAVNGHDAIEQVKTHPEIELVLMDIKMPLLDGYDATRQLKQLRPELPVIALTAFAFAEDREKALAAGCDDYLSKPVNKVRLLDMLEIYLPGDE